MTKRPVVFMGVEGVLEGPRAADGFVCSPVDGADGLWSVERGEALLGLGADLVWATDWSIREEWHRSDVLDDFAQRAGLPEGLARVPLEGLHQPEPGNTGLVRAVYEYLETHRVERFVWVDPRLGPLDRELIEAWPYPALPVRPSILFGLSATEVEEIRLWLAETSATALN